MSESTQTTNDNQEAELPRVEHSTSAGHMDQLLNHEYDGIQEYDNPLPGWWKNIFWASFYFSIGYIIYFHFGGGGLSPYQEYEKDVAVWNYTQAKLAAKFAALPLEKQFSNALKVKAKHLAAGKKLWMGKGTCFTCHLADGGGLIGPNLTDNYWINGPKSKRKEGPTLRDIYHVITYGGRPNKGMNPFEKSLSAMERVQLSLYVASLRGKKPKKAKPRASEARLYKYVTSKIVP